MTTMKQLRHTTSAFTASAVLLLASGGSALAAKPASVPPSGSTCGSFYGSIVAGEARSGHLNADINPGVLHQGFAGAEAFPHFSCR